MSNIILNKGFAIAIAWPATYCKQPGSWYDSFAFKLGFNHNNYYKVGHAALVLVNPEKLTCHYFDFGRYHAPFQYGRVRSEYTDHDLKMNTQPKISNNGKVLLNFIDILNELQHNEACHGEGEIHASYGLVDFNKSLTKVKQMQATHAIPYGPFKWGGSNCSRFVCSVIRAGKPTLKQRLKLKYKVPLSPTPISNVKALKHYTIGPKKLNNTAFLPINPLSKKLLYSELQAPIRHQSIPENAQWLSGEGAGSWYAFQWQGSLLLANRYSPKGKTECLGLFKNKEFVRRSDLAKFQITYPSNCAQLTFIIDNTKFEFIRINF